MPYVALKKMRVEGDVIRNPGDVVPEAEHWKNVRAYLDSHIKWVEPAPIPEVIPAQADPPFLKLTPSFSEAASAAKPAVPRNDTPEVPTPRGTAGRKGGRPKKAVTE